MEKLLDVLYFKQQCSNKVQKDLEKYINQGGLLGAFTYFLIYLKTNNETTAETAASIPACLFMMSSLHDDAIDEEDLKRLLNTRITSGDIIYSYIIECVDEIPEEFDISEITQKFREIGDDQLSEEKDISPTNLSFEEAINKAEDRGAVWGELAITPVIASGYYNDDARQYKRINTICSNLLFILTIVDDVEDIPIDIENDVVNIPLILHDKELSDFESKKELIDDFLDSKTPEQLDKVIKEREKKIENAASEFVNDSGYSEIELLTAMNHALEWYQNSACTIPVNQTVSKEQQQEVKASIESDDESKREDYIRKVVSDFPVRFTLQDEFRHELVDLPVSSLSSAIIKITHIEKLSNSVMTTSLEDALQNVQTKSESGLFND